MPQRPDDAAVGVAYTYQVLDRWYMCWCDDDGVWQGPYRITEAMRRTWIAICKLPVAEVPHGAA